MKPNVPSTTVLSSSEIELHYKRPLFSSMKHIASSEDADNILREFIYVDRIDLKEFFWVILLTCSNRVLGISEVGAGSSKGVVVNIKEILQLALLSNASAVILAHNHPSGNLNFSGSDKRLTNKLKKLTDFMEVTLLDHLIITSESYTSFADNGEF